MSQISLLLVVMLVILPLAGCLEGPTPSRESVTIAGVGNASWAPIVPMSRATFVEYDPDAYNDDLAYLAALPTTIFAEGDAVYASPLLFYRDQGVASSPEERALNDTQGIHYLMEDWLAVNGHGLGRVDIIGSAPYEGDETVTYGTDPIATSAALALDNWKYSREAVVVPVDPRVSDTFETVSGEVRGILDEGEIVEYRFSGSKLPDPVKPDRYTFDVDEGHYYVDAYLNWTWAGQTVAPDGSAATERGKDLDLQLYDGALGEVAASEVWNVIQGNLERPFQPPYERCLSLAFHTGKWEATVTYMPTKSIGPAAGPTSEDSRAYYNILVKVYPGVVVDIPDEVRALGAGARFVLSGGGNLGLVLIGPAGEEVASVMDGSDPKTLDLSSIGTGRYRVAVISLDGSGGVFTVTYSWEDTRKPVTAHMLASAAVGAVYASLRNIPLIYVGMGSVPSSARRALDRLGTERVHLFNLGDYSGVASKLDYRSWDEPRLEVDEVTSYPEAYRMIRSISGSNDVVFTTVTGWQHWYPGSDGPEGVDPRGTSVGPAAYAAAAHGAPVLVTDVHPEFSGPAAWHSNYWIQAYPNRMPPGVGSMVLTGRMVYDLLGELGLDGEGKEDIITVAGHLNIGQAWDRTFVGVANPGRIAGTPVDQSVWVCRNALYPALIFANPAVNTDVDPHGTLRITGSRSVAPGVIDEPEHEVEAPFVVAQTWVSYQHRFNERASKYWGTSYVGPSGVSPYWTESGDPIDEGNTNYPGERGEGRYYPDMTTSEVVPFYAGKAGYSSVFTTAFGPTMENLNRGAIMWFEVMHGGHQSYGDGSGVVGFWNDDGTSRGVPGQPDKDPWRGYEKFGCTDENPAERAGPDSMTMSKQAGLDMFPAVGRDPITGDLYDDHDGVVIAIAEQATQTNLITGIDIDDALRNIHSMGFVAGSCLIADTYLQLALIRHGSIFQVIDPWLTSWYSAFAIEMFMRQVALGYSVGEAYAEGMHHVGIEYLTGQWWWDIFENVVYFGDPGLYVYSPAHPWDRPAMLNATGGPVVGWHAPFGVDGHPGAISGVGNYVYAGIGGAAVAVATVVLLRRWRGGDRTDI